MINLKEILCRKKVAEIRKKYYKAEKRVCKKVLKNNDGKYEFLIKSSFVEFRKRYFSNLYNVINSIVNNSIGSIEGEMRAYISEKERIRTFEINNIRYCILEDEALPNTNSLKRLSLVLKKIHIN